MARRKKIELYMKTEHYIWLNRICKNNDLKDINSSIEHMLLVGDDEYTTETSVLSRSHYWTLFSLLQKYELNTLNKTILHITKSLVNFE